MMLILSFNTYINVNGQLYATDTLSQEKSSGSRWVGDWVPASGAVGGGKHFLLLVGV